MFDIFWYYRENNLDVKTISEIFNLTDIQTKRILNDQERKWNSSKHLRNLPPSWKSNATIKLKL
jgi:arsenate reductase-like glutaredoxin family protein